jgi:flagellar basal-body rod protein FlgB
MARILLKTFRMIAPLFNDPQYQSLRAVLDVASARHQALAGNIANVNTPGYQRLDTNPVFQQELERAIKSGDSEKLQQMTPKISVDTNAVSFRKDGNNVNLEREMVELTKNSVQFDVSATLLAKRYAALRMAITGRG